MKNIKKPSKEKMKKAIEDLELRTLDNLYNGEDKQKDRDKKIQEDEMKKQKALELYEYNKKEINRFLHEQNMSSIRDYILLSDIVRYKFDDYKIYGNSIEDEQKKILEKYKNFLNAFGITKLNMNKFEEFSFIPSPILALKAKRIRNEYLNVNDKRYFIPEFIITIPKDYLDEYFYLHIVANELCDGILTKSSIPNELQERLKWELYPIIFIDKEHGKHVRQEIKTSAGFLDKNKEYIDFN